MAELKNFVIVSGMHRSGTSYLARAMNMCGLHLGPPSELLDTETNPNFGNPKGHWENADAIRINEEILESNGGSWSNPPERLDRSPESLDSDVESLVSRIGSMHALSYGIKDPRFVLTLQHWLKNLPGETAMVGIFRHPLKVAESLRVRDRLNYGHSLGLWLRYNRGLLKQADTASGFFLLDFDWNRDRLLDETLSVAKRLGLADTDISSWLTDDLKKSDRSYDNSFRMSDEVASVYGQLQDLSSGHRAAAGSAPAPPVLSADEYKLIIRDTLESCNMLYKKSVEEAGSRLGRLEESQDEILSNPIVQLLMIYSRREDLQKSFPQVAGGDLYELVKWGSMAASGNIKTDTEAGRQLEPSLMWYLQYMEAHAPAHEKIKDQANKIKEMTEERHHLAMIIKDHQSHISALEGQYRSLEGQYYALEGQYRSLEGQYRALEGQHHTLGDHYYSVLSELEKIKASRGFRAMRIIASGIDRLVGAGDANADTPTQPQSTPAGIGPTLSASVQMVEDKGLPYFLSKAKTKILSGDLSVQSQSFEAAPVTFEADRTGDGKRADSIRQGHADLDVLEPMPYDALATGQTFDISVVIPTGSTTQRIQKLIRQLSEQRHVGSLELVLVNLGDADVSGLHDLVRELRPGISLRVHDANPSGFGHGRTRNEGAALCSNEYLLFMSDDAVPAFDDLFSSMCGAVARDGRIAAATARQIPRSDGDLMSCFSISYFYEFLGLEGDRVSRSDNFEGLGPQERRRASQIDDVCACYRRDLFMKYMYAEDIPYAEDIELGARLIRDGFGIAQLSSTGVIHSHSRPPSYYLKRHFVESVVLDPLLNSQHTDFGFHGICDFADLVLDHVMPAYRALNRATGRMRALLGSADDLGIDGIFSSIPAMLESASDQSDQGAASEPSLDRILEQLRDCLDEQEGGREKEGGQEERKTNIVSHNLVLTLGPFRDFLKSARPEPGADDISDFTVTLYKLFGSTVGNVLGGFFLEKIRAESGDPNREIDVATATAELLRRGNGRGDRDGPAALSVDDKIVRVLTGGV